jgi:hypothetical protein
MPIEQSIWKLADTPQKLSEDMIDSEFKLEELITKDVGILNDNWLIVGRQVTTDFNSYVDLLAIDAAGTLIVIELKRAKTPREVVAQAIDYASWAEKLEADQLAEIYEKYSEKYLNKKLSLNDAIINKFGNNLSEDDINQSLQIVIVGSELDSSTERIVQFLNDKKIPINVLFFRVFVDGENKYLSRAWLIDPVETQGVVTSSSRESEPWNGEYYVSFGHDVQRNWNDARKYGFISGGGGRWYTKTLNKLNEGDRVWVNVPKVGYVGVGVVIDTVRRLSDFTVDDGNERVPYVEAPKESLLKLDNINDDDKSEYFVPVKWIKNVPLEQAASEIGYFGNQNTVCQPTTPKWSHTVQRLKTIWHIE